MTPDDLAPPNQRQRKTLDDIRREIDAEFAATVPEDEGLDARDASPALRRLRRLDDAVTVERRRRARRRGRRVIGYLAAGAVGAVIGQAGLLAYVGLAHRGADLFRPGAGGVVAAARGTTTPAAPNAAPVAPSVSEAPVASSLAAEAPETPAEPGVAPSESEAPNASTASSAAPSAPVAPLAPASEVPEATPPRAVDRAAPSAPAVTPPTRPRVADVADDSELPARRAARPRPVSAPAPAAPLHYSVAGPGDWAESQAQVRAALTKWLTASDPRFVDVRASQAEVVLGADGRTAKTRFPVADGRGSGFRELRWERGADGWRLVGEHDATAAPR